MTKVKLKITGDSSQMQLASSPYQIQFGASVLRVRVEGLDDPIKSHPASRHRYILGFMQDLPLNNRDPSRERFREDKWAAVDYNNSAHGLCEELTG